MKLAGEVPEGGNLFKHWKEIENRRKTQFALVMQERRKFKLTQSPPAEGSPVSEHKSQSPPPPSGNTSRIHSKRASTLISSGSPISA